MKRDLVIIGGGPAGLACAVSAYENGVKDILVLERDEKLGGILNQCIHNGFGLHTFKEELTGPEYAEKFIRKVKEYGIEYKLSSMVIDIKPHYVLYLNEDEALVEVEASAIALAMGCRERAFGSLQISSERPSGIFSAGTAQRFINMEGKAVGKKIFILGSGDIGLIMARRLILEGAKVLGVAELMPYSGGLKRNIVQCLEDFGVPLYLSHTVKKIEGKKRVEGVTIVEVDKNRNYISGTEKSFSCDTILLSVGLIPENELSKKAMVELSTVTNGPVVNNTFETSVDGIFACGNVLHVHDLVDYVTEEANEVGYSVSRYLNGDKTKPGNVIKISAEKGVRYTVPQVLDLTTVKHDITIRFRVDNVYKDHNIVLYLNDKKIREVNKRILTPGEMESLKLRLKEMEEYKNLESIRIRLEARE